MKCLFKQVYINVYSYDEELHLCKVEKTFLLLPQNESRFRHPFRHHFLTLLQEHSHGNQQLLHNMLYLMAIKPTPYNPQEVGKYLHPILIDLEIVAFELHLFRLQQ